MLRVVHLLPYNGIGGAESAARSMADAPPPDIAFCLRFVFPKVITQTQRRATFNPFGFLSATRAVLREKPDVLVCSLWRACIVGTMVKLLRRKTRLAVFIHNSVDAHAADFAFTRIALHFADAVWVDSESSLRLRFRRALRKPVAIIPFLTHHIEPIVTNDSALVPAPDFIFWGRIAAQKNLSRSISLFALVRRMHPNARFMVVGPDSGELTALQLLCQTNGLSDAVRFAGPMSFDAISALAKDYSFYLQTSDYEGMAMSVVEAMQLGLVPVVTPAGEIGQYCRGGVNAIIIKDDGQAAGDVLDVLGSPARWREMRERAMATWHNRPLYRDAVAAACRNLLAGKES